MKESIDCVELDFIEPLIFFVRCFFDAKELT